MRQVDVQVDVRIAVAVRSPYRDGRQAEGDEGARPDDAERERQGDRVKGPSADPQHQGDLPAAISFHFIRAPDAKNAETGRAGGPW